jgi:polyisoprenoid-binding protein YceI
MNVVDPSLPNSPTTSQTAPPAHPTTDMITTYRIDPSHSYIGFSIRHMMITNVHGEFERIGGVLTLDSSYLYNSKIAVEIDASSINTRDAQRDAHLRSADFFDVATYPTITFVSKTIDKRREGHFKIIGDLSMHGITREVEIISEPLSQEMKDPFGNVKIAVSATAKIKRKDFGLQWNAALETGGFLVGDDVNISLDIQFVKVG